MTLEFQVNKRISSSGSSALGGFGSSASSASAQPLEPFDTSNYAGSYNRTNPVIHSADNSTHNLAYRVKRHHIPIETPQEKDLDESVKEETGATPGILSRLGEHLKNKYLAGILAGSLALSGMAFPQQRQDYSAKQGTNQSEQYALSQPAAVFPQFADGAGYRTRIVITYPSKDASDKPEILTLTFLGGQNGQAMPVTMKDSNLRSSTFTYTLNPKARIEVETTGDGTTARSGYAVMESNAANSKVVPSIVYFTPNESAVSSSKSKPLAEQFFDAKKTLEETTAAAFVNADTTKSANTTLYLADDSGREVDRRTMTFAPGGYLALTLAELFPILAKNNNFKGTVSAVGDPLYAIALGFNKFDNLWTVASGEGATYTPVIVPKDVDINLKIADVVSLAPMNGVVSTVNINNAQYQTSTGTLSVKLKPGNYTINANNNSIFPEWKILRYSANCDGDNAAQMDLDKTTMTFNVPDTAGSLDACVIGIPNAFVGTRNTENVIITKDYFQSTFGGKLVKFANPGDVVMVYRNLTGTTDTVTKSNLLTFINYFNSKARHTKLRFQDGGTMPQSNYFDIRVNGQRPSNGPIYNNNLPNTIDHTIMELGSDVMFSISSSTDVIGEETIEGLGNLVGFNRIYWFTKVNSNGAVTFSPTGETVVATEDNFSPGTVFKKF